MKNRFQRTVALLLTVIVLLGMSPAVYAADMPQETTTAEMSQQASPPAASEPEIGDAEDNTGSTLPEAPAHPEEDSDMTQEEIDALLEQVYQQAAVDGQIPAYLPKRYVEEAINSLLGREPLPNAEDDRDLKGYVTPTQEHTLFIPQTYYNLYWKNPNNGNRWQQWSGKWWIRKFVYFDLDNGQTAFCIEPFNDNAGIGEGKVPTNWNDIHCHWSSVGGQFEQEKQRGISLVLAYGAPNNGDESQSGKFATAALVWDMSCGYRKTDGSLRFGTSPFEKVLKANQPDVYAKYTAILEALKDHGKVPSFSVKFSSQITENETHTLTLGSDGNYSVNLHDNNGVLGHFNYVSSLDGLSFYKSGNNLTITATPTAAENLTNGVTFRNRGNEVEIGPDVCTVWKGASNSGRQLMVSMNGKLDPTPSCFRLRVENPKGRLVIPKWTNTGSSWGGWHFNVYRDSACTDLVDTCTTGSDGYAWSDYLAPGTYYVKEVDESDQYPYWQFDDSVRRYEVYAGQDTWGTSEQGFYNNLRGRLVIPKWTNTGSSWGGWHFNIYKDEACTQLVDTCTTNNDGYAWSDYLAPGTYYVKEVDESDQYPYWQFDDSVHQYVVYAGQDTWGTSEQCFYNHLKGKIRFMKFTNTEGNWDGWQINLYRDEGCTDIVGTYVTDSDGYAYTDYLEPGTYYAKEIGHIDGTRPEWSVDPKVVVYEVKPGETCWSTNEQAFVNNLKPGAIKIAKVDPEGKPLAGAKFLLEYSEDGGSTWLPVHKPADWRLRIGDCSSPELGSDGTLVSGADGLVSFEGLYPTIQYRLTEVEAPEGYQLLAGTAWQGSLPEGDYTVTLTVYNSRNFILPATGSINRLLLLAGSILLIFSAYRITMEERKKKK